MNESKSTETKKKVSRKVTKRQRNLRNTIMMAGLSVVLLSGATYAWFTLSETAKITNLTLTVGEAGGLQIADIQGNDDAHGAYSTEIEIPEVENQNKLMPATMLEGNKLNYPTYQDGVLDHITEIQEDEANKGTLYDRYEDGSGKDVYYITKTFYLKTDKGTNETQYGIALSPSVLTGNTSGYLASDPKVSGTYVLCTNKTAQPADNLYASAALRISFTNNSIADSGTTIYEPNSDVDVTGGTGASLKADLEIQEMDSNIKQLKNGAFSSDTTAASNEIFKILGGGTDNQIVMRIWVEGEDAQCVNEVAIDEMVARIQFTLTGTETTQ